MKRFLYIEETDGGMAPIVVGSASELNGLCGWMHESCKADDMALINWMNTAEIGEYYEHRLGIMVRLKDKR